MQMRYIILTQLHVFLINSLTRAYISEDKGAIMRSEKSN